MSLPLCACELVIRVSSHPQWPAVFSVPILLPETHIFMVRMLYKNDIMTHLKTGSAIKFYYHFAIIYSLFKGYVVLNPYAQCNGSL